MPVSLHHDFTTQTLAGIVGSAFTVVRASEAGYWDENGIWQVAGNNVARYQHDPVTNEIQGILIEGERTNIVVESSDFTTGSWAENQTLNADQATGRDGTTSMDQLIDSAGTGSGEVRISSSAITTDASTLYALSIDFAADGLDWARLAFINMSTLDLTAFFDLTNGVAGTAGSDVIDSGVEDIGGGRFRCWLLFESHGVDTSGNIRINVADGDGDVTVDYDGTSSIFIDCVQLERVQAGVPGSSAPAATLPTVFASSYIPTSGSAVTRERDRIQTSATNFNPAEGAIYTKGYSYHNQEHASTIRLEISSDGATGTDRLYHEHQENGELGGSLRGMILDGGPGSNVSIDSLVLNTPGTHNGVATSYISGTVHYAVDGVLGTTSPASPTGVWPGGWGGTFDTITLGGTAGSTPLELFGVIAEIALFDTALTEQETLALSLGNFPVLPATKGGRRKPRVVFVDQEEEEPAAPPVPEKRMLRMTPEVRAMLDRHKKGNGANPDGSLIGKRKGLTN